MHIKIKNFAMRFFDRKFDFRVRLFNVLAVAGVGISLATFILNIITQMWASVIISGILTALSAGLLVFTYKTGKYQIGYIVTIVNIFMVFFPILFFVSGGYKSGMPSMFIFAVLFTVLMLEGKKALFVSFAEVLEYISVCIIGYMNPQLVTWFHTDAEMLTDIIVTTTAVSISCFIVLFLHLKEYEAQRKQLAEQNEQLKRHDEAKSVFLTTVAHEIKNPLNAINLHARDTFEVLDEKNPDTEIMKQNQKTIEKMVVRIDKIVVELMDTVAIEQGRLALDISPVSMAHLLHEAAEACFGKSYNGNNRPAFDIAEDLPLIQADYARIMQVIINLISNSMQHTKNGVIIISLKESDSGQLISVSDNGDGMSEEIKRKAFDGYVSVSKEYWRHGIGLFVCRQIIDAHGGKIWIESELGKGTTVSFILPYAEDK